MNDIKTRLSMGETVFGIFINMGSTVSVEIAGLAGFDFIIIDSEHGQTMPLENRNLICAAEYRNIAPFVRVPNGSYDMILRTLDIGAHGVMVPQVNTAEKAAAIVEAAKYSPLGNRGVAPVRCSDYGFTTLDDGYFRMANERNIVIVQCENIKAVSHLDSICSLPGIDVVFIGPYDLSSSMKQIGRVDYEYIRETVDIVLSTTKLYGKTAGIFTRSIQEAKEYAQRGFRFIVVGSDISCLGEGMRNMVYSLQKHDG